MNKFSTIETYIKKIFKTLSKNKDFEFFYNRGIDFFNKKKYENALIEFKSALATSEVKPQVYYNMGLSYHYLEEYDKAVMFYNKFLAFQPEDYDGLYNLGLTYYIIENYTKSSEVFEKCLALKKDEDGIKALALSYLELGELQKVIELADNLLQDEVDGKKLFYVIAKVFENKNSFNRDFIYIDTAIDLYLKMGSIDSENHNLYLSISICYAKKGDWENSVKYCKIALEKQPDSYEVNNQMGLVYYCCNQVEEAIKHYEKALALKPDGDYKIYSNLAYAYEQFGQKKKAIKVFTALVNKFPNYPARDEIKNHLRILRTID